MHSKDPSAGKAPIQQAHPGNGGRSQTEEQALPAVAGTDDAYRVILYNDEEHSFDEVIYQIIKATACARAKAETITWEVHAKGRAIVTTGSMERCILVSAVLEEIDLRTEIQTA